MRSVVATPLCRRDRASAAIHIEPEPLRIINLNLKERDVFVQLEQNGGRSFVSVFDACDARAKLAGRKTKE
jgi:hypothetical protein